jgi:IrrE N-terminal-like domain
VKWVPDRTGRFPQRPHWQPGELDAECERILLELRPPDRAGVYPMTTNELTVMIETQIKDLDLYADLEPEGKDLQGVTDFFIGTRPNIRISKTLTEDPRRENRLRTTLTHELGHVRLHGFLVELERPIPMFDSIEESPFAVLAAPQEKVSCFRGTITDAPERDWMEWQAAYASGALLMPATALRSTSRAIVASSRSLARPVDHTAQAAELINAVQQAFAVSEEAARVRLIKLNILLPAGSAESLSVF